MKKNQYTIHWFYGDDFDPEIAIKSKSVRGVSMPIAHKDDAMFLVALGQSKNTEPYYVGEKRVCVFYDRKQYSVIEESKLSEDEKQAKFSKTAKIRIDSAKLRLRKMGLDPKQLFEKIPNESAWRLHPSVTLRGFASVNKRSPGFGGEYQERDMMNDIEDPDAIDLNYKGDLYNE